MAHQCTPARTASTGPLPAARRADINPHRRGSRADRFPGAQMPLTFNAIMPIVLLVLSNLFMTTAWYGHLKFPARRSLSR